MIYANRNRDGKIISVSMHPDEKHTEAMPSDARELVDFMQELADHQAELAESDQTFVRVLDDLIKVLLDKNLLNLDELPEKAREKILARQSLRSLGQNGD